MNFDQIFIFVLIKTSSKLNILIFVQMQFLYCVYRVFHTLKLDSDTTLMHTWQWNILLNDQMRIGKEWTMEHERLNGCSWWGYHKISTRATNQPKRTETACIAADGAAAAVATTLKVMAAHESSLDWYFSLSLRQYKSTTGQWKIWGEKNWQGEGPLVPKKAKCHFYLASNKLKSTFFYP